MLNNALYLYFLLVLASVALHASQHDNARSQMASAQSSLCDVSSLSQEQKDNTLVNLLEKDFWDEETISALLYSGANPNARHHELQNGLLTAINRRASIELIKLFIAKGADLHRTGLYNRGTPLHYAVTDCNAAIVEMMLAAGANKNALDNDDNTPLILAVLGKRLDTCKALLAAKVDITALGYKKWGLSYQKIDVLNCIRLANEDSLKKRQILSVFDALNPGLNVATLQTTGAKQIYHAYQDFLQGDHDQLKTLLLETPDVLLRIAKLNKMRGIVLWRLLDDITQVFKPTSVKPLLYFLADKKRFRTIANTILDYQQQQQSPKESR